MKDKYPISVREMVVIAVKAIGKEIPILRNIIDVSGDVFGAIEMNRIKVVLEEVLLRISQIEEVTGVSQVFDQKTCSILVYAADQVRSDLLADAKAKEYGSAIAHYVKHPSDLNEVFEVLDYLRKLSVNDLKILYQFRISEQFFDNRSVLELAGYQEHIDPFESSASLRAKMEKKYPILMRLQGLGVIYLSYEHSSDIGIQPDIGGLSQEAKKFAFLTESGKQLVKVLPLKKEAEKA